MPKIPSKSRLQLSKCIMTHLTNSLRILLVLFLLSGGKSLVSQTCTVNFSSFTNGMGFYGFTVTTAAGSNSTTVYTWNFGSGAPSFSATGAAGLYPSYQYTASGIYTVTLTAFTPPNCFASASQTIQVTVPTCSLVPGFTYSNTAINGLIDFFDTSTGTDWSSTYSWNFGNGNQSNLQNPGTTYTANGTYTVTLFVTTASVPNCTATISQTIAVSNVTTSPCNLSANFTFSYAPNGVVNFYDSSTGTGTFVSYSWYSYQNLLTSFSQNPSFYYAVNGSYTVRLLVTNQNTMPLCQDSILQQVIITNAVGPCTLQAGFSHSVGANGLVNFSNTSVGTLSNTSYFWNFGDGSTGSGANPSHTFPSSGLFYVELNAINALNLCEDTIGQVINVTGINCLANSNFSVAPTNTAQYWTATPAFPWNINNAVWSWGDGSGSNLLYTSHTYSAAGNYQICLSVTVNCGSSSSTCATYSISKINADNAMIQINVVPPELIEVGLDKIGSVLNEVRFYPNPSSGLFYLESNFIKNETIEIKVMDINGKLVYVSQLLPTESEKTQEISLKKLPDGVYFLQLEQSGKQVNKKLIISKD